MDLILFGMQGSGKGTQGKILADRYNLEVFDTGSELRKLAKEESPLAQKVKEIMESGRLVPAEVVMEIIENFIEKSTKNILFDGIPRSLEQYELFNKITEKHNRSCKCVLINLTTEQAMDRLLARRMCQECKTIYPKSHETDICSKCNGELITRSDDNEQSIKVRLETYEKETLPVIEIYKNKDCLYKINGDQDIEKVSEDMFKVLDPIMKK